MTQAHIYAVGTIAVLIVSGCAQENKRESEASNVIQAQVSSGGSPIVSPRDWLGKLYSLPEKLPANTLGSNYPEIIVDLYKYGQKDEYETSQVWQDRLDGMPAYLADKYGSYFVFRIPVIESSWSYTADRAVLSRVDGPSSYFMLLDTVKSDGYSIRFSIGPTQCQAISFENVSPELAKSVKDPSRGPEVVGPRYVYAVGKLDVSQNGFISRDRSTLSHMQPAGFEHVPGIKFMGVGDKSFMLTADFIPSYYAIVDDSSGEVLSRSACR